MRLLGLLLFVSGCFTELGIGPTRSFAPWQDQAGWGFIVSISGGQDFSKEPRKQRVLVGTSTDFIVTPTADPMTLALVAGADLHRNNARTSVSIRIGLGIAPDAEFVNERGHLGAWDVPAYVGPSWRIADNGTVSIGASLLYCRGYNRGETMFAVGPMLRISETHGFLDELHRRGH